MTGQNKSTAVMQRRKAAPDSLDYFPTPPWATRALCEWMLHQGYDLSGMDAWEPACGEMHMAKPMAEYFRRVRASDCHAYSGDTEILDFPLMGGFEPDTDMIWSNPPFRLAEEFIHTALSCAKQGVAMLLRSAFLEGGQRYDSLFSRTPPTHVLQFVERVAMLEGRLIRAGEVDPATGNPVSSATAYCWLFWDKHLLGQPTVLHWIPRCRAQLEREGDYPELTKVRAADIPLFDGAANG